MSSHAVPRLASGRELVLFSVLNGAGVSTLYWAQSLVVQASAEFGTSLAVKLMPGATLAGYAAGVALLAAVARDLTSPAGLTLHLLLLTAGLCAVASAPGPTIAAAACLLIGLGCSLTQRLMACATNAVPAAARSETIGRVIAGGLLGIVLARACVPLASAWLGWRTMFWTDALIVTALGAGVVLTFDRADLALQNVRRELPSATALWRNERVLRRAAVQQALVFAAFNFGWALFPRLLRVDSLAPSLPMGSVAILGAGAAVLSGRLCGDRNPAMVARAGLLMVLGATLALIATVTLEHRPSAVLYCVAMAFLDIGTQIALVANQARAQALAATPPVRGRITAIVTTVGFAGGAIGAAMGNLLG